MMEETTQWTIVLCEKSCEKTHWIIRPLRFKFELLMKYHEQEFLTRTSEGF